MSIGAAIRAEDIHKDQDRQMQNPPKPSPRRTGPRPRLPKRVKQMTSKDYMKHMTKQSQ